MTKPGDEPRAAEPSSRTGAYVLPEPLSYRLKKRLLGPPLITERLSEQKLNKVLALGVLSPDCISSTAYGSEEMLNQLVQYIGVAAFSLLLPLTGAILLVLFFVTLSYREVVMVYTKAGGSYVVSRENFGPRVAQIAAVALIIDYILTVAVQTAAGTDALISAVSVGGSLVLTPYRVYITVAVIVLLTWGNLRGIREAGRTFALPTYLFITGVGSLVVIGLVRAVLGQVHAHSIHLPGVQVGHPGEGLLMGASIIMVLRAFANGGASLTGLEAISNGVANFRPPEGRNARRVLVVMSMTLGSLVLGVSILAYLTHAVPYVIGTPTVLSQEARYIFGSSIGGKFGFYYIQAVTMLILYTGANTSFNGFPNLASFVAEDAYLPRQLTRRGHRLVFSNGIIILAALSAALVIGTHSSLSALVALYAIGVFVGFTMAGAGMVKHHLTMRESGWRYKIWINGFASLLSASIVLILAVVKFTQGAWLVVVLFPILFVTLVRLHRQYEDEKAELEANTSRAVAAPILRRLVALVFVERLDLATARALQYARTLHPDELRAVHFVLDTTVAEELEAQWIRLGLTQFPLDLIECPDRRLTRASMELVAEAAADGQTEVSVLLPRRVFEGAWRLALHDRTADRIAAYVSQLPNANATIVPFPLGKKRKVLVPWTAGSQSYAAGSDVFNELTETGGDTGRHGRDAGTPRRRRDGSSGTLRRRRDGPGDRPADATATAAADPADATATAASDPADATATAASDPADATAAIPSGGGGRPSSDEVMAGEGIGEGESARSTGERHPWARGVGEGESARSTGDSHPSSREGGGGQSRSAEPTEPGIADERRRERGWSVPPGTMRVGELRPRQRARLRGRIRSVRVQAGGGVPSVECVLADESGTILLIFQGRRRVAGIEPGATLDVEGTVGERGRKLAMLNPGYSIIRAVEGTERGPSGPPPGRR